jgi:hypothetical protein
LYRRTLNWPLYDPDDRIRLIGQWLERLEQTRGLRAVASNAPAAMVG